VVLDIVGARAGFPYSNIGYHWLWRVPAVGINRSRVADSQHHPVCVTFPPPLNQTLRCFRLTSFGVFRGGFGPFFGLLFLAPLLCRQAPRFRRID
jgi:hypothetical protein